MHNKILTNARLLSDPELTYIFLLKHEQMPQIRCSK